MRVWGVSLIKLHPFDVLDEERPVLQNGNDFISDHLNSQTCVSDLIIQSTLAGIDYARRSLAETGVADASIDRIIEGCF